MTTRRGVLKLVGGGVVLAALGGTGFYLANGPSDEARVAWRDAGAPEEYRRRFLSYALLAPNPHNRQPWLVRLEGEDSLTLFCDLDRRLPETDPFDRQIVMGCGAFLELLSIAAAHEGYTAEITPFPEGDTGPRLDGRAVARVRFVAGAAQADPAFAAIGIRRTNRNKYTERDVAADLLAQLEAAGSVHGVTARTTAETGLVARLRDITWRGHETESLTHRTMKESIDLMRIGKAEVEQWRDGLVLEGPMMELARMTGMISHAALLDPKSDAFKMGLDMFRAMAASARAYAWLINDHDGRTSELNAGRAYARLALKAAELGLAIHPWSQTLQEFPEMRSLYDEVHALIGGGKRVQMLVRVGYADPVIPAPRRGLAAHILDEAQN
jgi:hypothetical protein